MRVALVIVASPLALLLYVFSQAAATESTVGDALRYCLGQGAILVPPALVAAAVVVLLVTRYVGLQAMVAPAVYLGSMMILAEVVVGQGYGYFYLLYAGIAITVIFVVLLLLTLAAARTKELLRSSPRANHDEHRSPDGRVAPCPSGSRDSTRKASIVGRSSSS